MTTLKTLIYFSLIIFLTSCDKEYPNTGDDIIIKEFCYDGVVYIKSPNYSITSVKFKPNSQVETTKSDGQLCQ